MAFRIAHISDLHLPPLPAVSLHQVCNKRLLGYLSWHRKRKHRHRSEVIAALEADLRERAADHICITGDITNLGLPQEFMEARRWLQRLAPRETVTIVPGNHDAYVAASLDAMREHLHEWLPDAYPAATRRGSVLFIAVSTAVATPPTLATGRVGRDQLERLGVLLDENADPDLYRVLLIHHPPADGIVASRKALTDADGLARVLYDAPVDLVLHGHGHQPAHYALEARDGWIPVFGAGSASLMRDDPGRSGHYHLFELQDGRLSVTHCRYDAGQRRYVASKPVPVPEHPR